MRLVKLELLAYGPFRGLELGLEARGLHVVYGRNEAGKSTTLRAITGLLYGIERTTRDAHVHKPAELRIGGVLEAEDGRRLRLVRRKGNANTLLDEQGAAVPEDVMTRLLRGISEETFRHAFGLDHESLRKGAEALLEGKGDLGESLFDASVGGGGEVQRLLERLEKEADAIYRPRGQMLPLNEALKAFSDAQKAVKERQSLPEASVKQEQHLASLRAQLAGHVERKKTLSARRARLAAARQRVPLERRREQVVSVRAELGEIVGHAARLSALTTRIASYESDERRRHELASESLVLRDRALEAARRAGADAAHVEALERLRIDAKTEARLLRFVQERAAALERLRAHEAELARSERELARARAEAAEVVVDFAGPLARVLGRARALGDIEVRAASDAAKVARRRRELGERVVAAGLGAGSLDEVVGRTFPSVDLVERLAARAAEHERAMSRLLEKVAELESQSLSVEQQIAERTGDFAPPDAASLRRAREARDAAWARLRAEAAAGADARARVALEAEMERSLRDADDLADRMIREADRVTTLSRLRSSEATLVEQRSKLADDLAAARAARAGVDEDIARAFAPCGVSVAGFAEARALLVRVAQVVDAYAPLRELEEEVSELAATAAKARRELAAAIGGDAAEDRPLADLVDEAARRIDAAEAKRRAIEDAGKSAARLEELVAERRSAIAREEAAFADARARFAELAAPLGIAEDATAEEVTRALAALRDLFEAVDLRAEKDARAAAVAHEARAFEEDVARLAAELAPDLAGLPPREAAAALVARGDQAEAATRELAAIDARLAELGSDEVPEDLAAVAADADAAARALDALDEEIADVEAAISGMTRDLGGAEVGLRQLMRSDSLAAESASLAQEALARIRAHAERYCRAKVAATLLAREIERFREENQGPVLARASTLFARLTLGAYAGVRAGFDDRDRPCLLCVRAGGVDVGVDGLSEGTRDQLYLSLRLASLERHADVAEPMPLVLDDVLVQLDDERARAAIVVLAELAARTQVLFFTHHARLVELARAAVPEGALHVHELGARPAQVVGAQELLAEGAG